MFKGLKDRFKSIVDTIVTGIESVIEGLLGKANQDKVVGYQWISLLDSKVCPRCAALHGSSWMIADSKALAARGRLLNHPVPPAHRRCRCFLRSLFISDQTGDVPDFEGWLRTQPFSVAEDILGKSKARLWRDGGVRLDKFVDESGDELTLAELRERDAKAFDRAGLD